MTANELLALLGRAWPRLLLYPAGLTAWALVGLFGWLRRRGGAEPLAIRLGGWLDLSALALPWLGLALLPLPHVASIGQDLDLLAALALLEWPRILSIAHELAERCAEAQERAIRRAAAALNSYPPLILATLALASVGGSLNSATLARPPDDGTAAYLLWPHWLGALAWLLALPPALGIGPFAVGEPQTAALRLGLRLRAIGLVAFAALPWFPFVQSDDSAQAGFSLSWLLLPLPPLAIAALLWLFVKLSAGQPARRWAWGYLALDALLLLALLWSAAGALQARLS